MQVNSRYVPQLQEVLQWPQSAGIVGGRPSSSLYFVGHQGESVLFLDPHEVQEVRLSFCWALLLSSFNGLHLAWPTLLYYMGHQLEDVPCITQFTQKVCLLT